MIFGAVLSAKPYEKMSYKLDKLAPWQSRTIKRAESWQSSLTKPQAHGAES